MRRALSLPLFALWLLLIRGPALGAEPPSPARGTGAVAGAGEDDQVQRVQAAEPLPLNRIPGAGVTPPARPQPPRPVPPPPGAPTGLARATVSPGAGTGAAPTAGLTSLSSFG